MYKLKNYLKLVNIYNIQSKKENISPIIQITKIIMKKSKNVWFKLKWLPILTKRCINVRKGNFYSKINIFINFLNNEISKKFF